MARQQSFGYNKSITPARKLTTRLLRIAKRFEKKKDDLKIAQQQADLRRFRYVEIRNEDYCHTETISGIGDYSSGLQIKEAEREVQRIVERLRNDKDCDIYVHCGNSTVKMHSHLVFPQCGALAGNYNGQKRAAVIRGEDLQLPVLFELEISTRDFFVVIAFLYGHIQLTRRLVLGMVTGFVDFMQRAESFFHISYLCQIIALLHSRLFPAYSPLPPRQNETQRVGRFTSSSVKQAVKEPRQLHRRSAWFWQLILGRKMVFIARRVIPLPGLQEQPVEIGSSPEGPAPDVSVIQDEISALVDSMGSLVATGLGSGRRRSREDFESMDDLTSLMYGLSIEPKRRMAEKPSGACFQAPWHTWLAVILELLEGSGVEPDVPAADFVAWQGLYSHLQSLEECSQVLGDIFEDIDRVVRYWRQEYLDSKSDALAGKPVDMAEERKRILTTALRNTHRLMKSYVDDSDEYKKIIHIPENIRRHLIPLVQAIKVQRTQLESGVLIVWHFFGKEVLRNFWMEFVVNLISNLIFNHSFKTMASSSVFVSRRLPTRSSSRISSRLGARQTVSPAASSRGNTPSQSANRVTKNPTTPPKNAKPPANSQTAPKKVRWDPSVPAPDDIKRACGIDTCPGTKDRVGTGR
ncbi:hypothetical protein BJ508DRAFT_313145 [Ascobolus immersus RN42]|uniref:Uncharacterized protein n=1 Tax=Ascobolus immersus RN42 TaxID=1160509 RepID=A0A3N4HQP9_ASCIM|nr:hypothetical protein BJ508DRAFT_313145 [Ascobolus immersus RN42]